jgi:hypothetical protein
MKSTVTVLDLKSDASYARATDKLAELQARASDLERRRSEVVEEGFQRQVVLTARAQSLLDDDVIPVGADAEEARRRNDLAVVGDELAVVRRAVDAADARRPGTAAGVSGSMRAAAPAPPRDRRGHRRGASAAIDRVGGGAATARAPDRGGHRLFVDLAAHAFHRRPPE